jgi:hypothetical protein
MWVAQRALDLAESGVDYITALRFVYEAEVLDSEATGRHEALICGCNDGSVVTVDISGLARHADKATQSSDTDDRVVVRREHLRTLWKHTGCVLSMDVHDSLLATSDDNGVVRVALCGTPVATLHHDPQMVAKELEQQKKRVPPAEPVGSITGGRAVRAVLLWDGFAQWLQEFPNEESAAYLFAGADDGYVRLWRVDVESGKSAVIAVFGPPRVHDGHDAGATPGIFSVALDVDAKEGRPNGRLVAGTGNCWWAWPLENLTPQGLARPAPSTVAGACAWTADYLDVEAAIADGATLKPKVRAGTGARSFAMIAAAGASPTVSATLAGPVANRIHDDNVSSEALVPLNFSDLKKTVEWPASVVRLVDAATAWGSWHTGPTYTVRQHRPGMVVTAGSDGRICLARWSDSNTVAGNGASDRGYTVVGVLRGHTDLVKTLLPTTAPNAFVSASYDGTVRVWHLSEEVGVARCASVLVVEQGSQPLTRASKAKQHMHVVGGGVEIPEEERENAKHSVACAALFAEASTLFTVSLFERVVRTFMLLEVDSCDAPPGFIYNGARTLRVFADDAGQAEPSTTDLDPFGSRRADDDAVARHPLFGAAGASAGRVESVPDEA